MASRFYHYGAVALEKNKGKIRIDELMHEIQKFIDDDKKTFIVFKSDLFHSNLKVINIRLSILQHFDGVYVCIDNDRNILVAKIDFSLLEIDDVDAVRILNNPTHKMLVPL